MQDAQPPSPQAASPTSALPASMSGPSSTPAATTTPTLDVEPHAFMQALQLSTPQRHKQHANEDKLFQGTRLTHTDLLDDIEKHLIALPPHLRVRCPPVCQAPAARQQPPPRPLDAASALPITGMILGPNHDMHYQTQKPYGRHAMKITMKPCR